MSERNWTQPLFSVVVPTCHRNDTLALCLDRLAPGAQTLAFDQYEVIVTDDGESPTAKDLIRDRYSWARWTQGPRRGPAANRNHGASLAKGEWLAFTDDDCVPRPDWLYVLAAHIHDGIDALEGCVVPTGSLARDLTECPVNLSGGRFWSANVAVKAHVFRELRGFDERFPTAAHEDEDLYVRLLERTEVPFVPDAKVSHPVRVVGLRSALARVRLQSPSTALYYALHDRRLGILRWTTLLRWIYKPRLQSLAANVIAWKPRSALVEGAWLLIGNPVVLREYLRLKRSGIGAGT